jgi:TetR/AcrR family tetracycline transcriptional repressor
MRRLGAELGVDPMAAYRHLANKKALLAGVAEVTAVQAVGQLTTGAVLLEAFWREWAAAGGDVHLSPPLLPHPELPVLSAAADLGVLLKARAPHANR